MKHEIRNTKYEKNRNAKFETLPQSFFDRPTVTVAQELLGCRLMRRRDTRDDARAGTKGGKRGKPAIERFKRATERFTIVETEAYDGPRDLACHGSKGLTRRTAVLFGPPGHFYVYFTYGMHWLLNVVTGPEGYPSGVLIRGIESEDGARTIGPARITKKLGIDGKLHGKRAGAAAGLWIEGRGEPIRRGRIRRDVRVGIDYAGPVWARKKWRFILCAPTRNRTWTANFGGSRSIH